MSRPAHALLEANLSILVFVQLENLATPMLRQLGEYLAAGGGEKPIRGGNWGKGGPVPTFGTDGSKGGNSSSPPGQNAGWLQLSRYSRASTPRVGVNFSRRGVSANWQEQVFGKK